MLRCDYIELLLADYADGIGDTRTQRIVGRHVQLCARCREQVECFGRIGEQLRRLPLLPPGAAARIPRLRRRMEQRFAPRGGASWWAGLYIALLLAAMLLLLLLLALSAWRGL